MVIRTTEEVEYIRKSILTNANITCEHLKSRCNKLSSIAFLAEIKFDKIGVDPITGTALNFVEQLNQMFSDLVALEGAARLLCKYPGKELKLNLGSIAGFDIESTDGEVVAECFAVTTATSNRKLEKDCSKLMDKAPGKQKYIFFYSRSDTEGKLHRIYGKYPEIIFEKFTEFTY